MDQWILYTNGAYMSTAVPIEANQYYSVSLHLDSSGHTAELYVNGDKILAMLSP